MTTLEIIAPTNQSYTATLYERGSDTPIETFSLTENTNSKGVYKGTVTSNLTGYYKVIVYDGITPIVVTDVLFTGANTVYASDITLSTTSLTANNIWEHPDRTITGGTVDTLTNSPNVPSANAIASQVRTELTTELTRIDQNVSAPKTLTTNTLSSIISAMPDGLTAQQVWEYVTRELTQQVTIDLTPINDSLIALTDSVDAVYDRIVYTVPDGPAIPIPAPSSSNVTRVYSYCYNTHGRPVAGIPITIKMIDVSTSENKGSYLSDEFTFVSDQYGVASTEIPRGTGFRFRVRSGKNSQWIEFRGVDTETYQLPFLINK